MMHLLQDMGTELQLLIYIVSIAVVFFVVWLALRRTKLWYWKVNEQTAAIGAQTDTLASIERQLKVIGKNIEERASGEKIMHPKEAVDIDISPAAHDTGDVCMLSDSEQSDGEVRIRSKFITLDQCRSKSGHTYTVEQIEAQIRE